MARSYFWRPNQDAGIEHRVRQCSVCQTRRKLPASATLHPWEWPGTPWYRLHTDYAGPFEGRMVLIIIDAYSKFIDAHDMTPSTTSATVVKLRQTFATHGLPHVLVSDNGPCFTSDEFAMFCTMNGIIKHTRASPYHPASNGLAERAVQTAKEGLRKTTGDLETRLSRFLAQYRLMPQTTTGQAPSELLMNRRPRSRLDLVQPTLTSRVLNNQWTIITPPQLIEVSMLVIQYGLSMLRVLQNGYMVSMKTSWDPSHPHYI